MIYSYAHVSTKGQVRDGNSLEQVGIIISTVLTYDSMCDIMQSHYLGGTNIW